MLDYMYNIDGEEAIIKEFDDGDNVQVTFKHMQETIAFDSYEEAIKHLTKGGYHF